MSRSVLLVVFGSTVVLAILRLGLSDSPAQTPENPIDFNRDVRPILSDACFNCHGPDKSKRKASLHFDTAEGAGVGEHKAIVPGKPDESVLIQRVSAKDPTKRMPPPASGRPALRAEQIQILRRWIAAGARWQKHWSFIQPNKAPLPVVKNRAWPRNSIDHFILARLEQEGLAASPEADRITLIRRVSLDLTGLPPSPAEVAAFVVDKSPDAYEKVVDRLLASPRYGERMAQRWLDAARYADTNGYQTDGDRVMWRWRDWVIAAFNANMPLDQFTIEQLAGDMLPNATLEQRIATGFNRNHRGNSEGGIIPEEYAAEYVVDRVDTTATVWLGLTASCAKCHNHKYDPISQSEFYQLFAYFNNVPEKGRAIKYGNSPPMIKAPTAAQEMRRKLLEAQLAMAEEKWRRLQPELDGQQHTWEFTHRNPQPEDWTLRDGLLHQFVGTGKTLEPVWILDDEDFRSPIRRSMSTSYFDGKRELAFPHHDKKDGRNFGFFDKFTMAAWVYAADERAGSILSRMANEARGEGYHLAIENGKVHVHLVKRWLDDAIRVETEESFPCKAWRHVLFSYDGSREAHGVKIYIDGVAARLKVNLDELNQSFATKEAFRIGGGGGPDSYFHGSIDDVRVYDRVLTPSEAGAVANREPLSAIIQIPKEKRSAAQAYKLRRYYLDGHAPAQFKAAFTLLNRAKKELADFDESIPDTMVMEEMAKPRDTHVLIRGEYDRKGSKVHSGVPAVLSPPTANPNNRLAFARWLVQRDNALTARVTVNRLWQMVFGTGIVKTVEDFGAQGEWPSHPELLDWLAVEFMEHDWDMKALLKTILCSAAYRQSSKVTEDLLRRDPDNRHLARGPRTRLSAEMIRDQALFVSGLLVEKVGGPSVKPYQPAGLEKELHGTDDEGHDHGPNLYRRSLYTYWKRTVAPPGLATFDAANRETCVVRETRTNTPLQALNLLNDVTFVEAARVLAQRVMLEAGTTTAERLKLGFRLATCRAPNARELRFLVAGYDEHLKRFKRDLDAARKLVSAGESPRFEDLDLAEHAALSAMMNLILNLDEVICKE